MDSRKDGQTDHYRAPAFCGALMTCMNQVLIMDTLPTKFEAFGQIVREVSSEQGLGDQQWGHKKK